MRQMRQLYLSKICSLSKNLACRYKVGISSQQINYSVSVLTLIKSFARHTHIHACTPPYVYRAIHTFMHTCMNSYLKTSSPIITSAASIWFEIWGVVDPGKNIRFSRKVSMFLGNFTKKKKIFRENFRKISTFNR